MRGINTNDTINAKNVKQREHTDESQLQKFINIDKFTEKQIQGRHKLLMN